VDVSALRQDYAAGELRRATLDPDPIGQFGRWFADARACEAIMEPNAMTLATTDAQGQPHARIVLLKGFDAEGFRFFTNYASDKGAELAANPHAALLFHWVALERQVGICGRAERVSREESAAYFETRPLRSRMAAWASQQSRMIASRATLEARYAEVEKMYPDGQVPCPPNWGGYLIRPESVEFWQGRRSRLHDRFRYTPTTGSFWLIERLAP
jgi:pyridoxamine 5'-phosphate oxidase